MKCPSIQMSGSTSIRLSVRRWGHKRHELIHIGTWISQLLFKIEISFFFVNICLFNYRLLDLFVSLSVRVQKAYMYIDLSRLIFKIEVSFYFERIFCFLNKHLFCVRLVCQSIGQGTKGINVYMKKRRYLGCLFLILLFNFFGQCLHGYFAHQSLSTDSPSMYLIIYLHIFITYLYW